MTRRPDAGVTLLELLISLAILGMVTVTVASIFSSGRRVWERSGGFEASVDHAVARSALRGWIEDIPIPRAGGRGQFTGTSAEFSTSVPALVFVPDDPGFARITVSWDEDKSQVTSTAAPASPDQTWVSQAAVMGGDLESATITYFGRQQSQAPRTWHTSWTAASLPELVKIEMTGVDETPLPPLTIQPGKTDRQRYLSASSLVPPG